MNFQICRACGQHYWMTESQCPHCKASSKSKWLKGSTNAAVTLLLGLGVVGCNNEPNKDSALIMEPAGEPEYGVPAPGIDTADAPLYGVPDSGIDTADAPLYGVPDVDNDVDGFPMEVDCDDENPNTYPGAAELESTTACMTDEDGDGYGDSNPSNANVMPGTDCDDSNPDVFPGQGCE